MVLNGPRETHGSDTDVGEVVDGPIGVSLECATGIDVVNGEVFLFELDGVGRDFGGGVSHPGQLVALVLGSDQARADLEGLFFLVDNLDFTGRSRGNGNGEAEDDIIDGDTLGGVDEGVDEDSGGCDLSSVERVAEREWLAGLVNNSLPDTGVIDTRNLSLGSKEDVSIDVVALGGGGGRGANSDLMPVFLVLPDGKREARDPSLSDKLLEVDDGTVGVEAAQGGVDSFPGGVVAADSGDNDRLILTNLHEGLVD